MVQSELHPEDERREDDGNPGEPHADAPAPGVPEVVAVAPAETVQAWQVDQLHQIEAQQVGQTQQIEQPQIDGTQQIEQARQARLAQQRARYAALRDEVAAWLKTLVSAAVYALLIVTFGFQIARVEGESMAPTLEDQDRLIVNKLIYRIGEPRRGDIVMLYYPVNPSKSFVKRVIAEEGDSVHIVSGRVYVNDIPLKDDYVQENFRGNDDWGPEIIPEGYDFVMGDHRNNSSDSRHWGMVPKRYITGKVQIRWWPVATARVF